jgi:hypothetical protein
MQDIFEWDQALSQVPETNDLIFESSEGELRAYGEDAYFAKRAEVFPPRRPGTLGAVVDAEHEAILTDLARMLRSQGARVRVIISPVYDEMRVADSDRGALERAFGKENVCDFSGVNEWTENARNYYEESHYRPHVARDLMKIAYAEHPSGTCYPRAEDGLPTSDPPGRRP